MPNSFDGIVNKAAQEGVIIKRFCSFCTNSQTGTVSMQEPDGGVVEVPICIDCVKRFGIPSSVV